MCNDTLFAVDVRGHCMVVYNYRTQTSTVVGAFGALPGQFASPQAVAVDQLGHVFVADAGNMRLQVFDIRGRYVRHVNYPLTLRDVAATSTQAITVRMAVHNNAVFLYDSHVDVLWKLPY